MLCSYRYYVRPHRMGSSPGQPGAAKREEASTPPPAPEPRGPVIVDTPPHLAIVRQYAW